MRACDDDDGRPRHQVSRFHAVAPISAPAQIATPVAPIGTSMMSAPIVCATRTPAKPPSRFMTAASASAIRGRERAGRHRGGDGVGGVVEPVGVGEAHRQHDDERDRQPVHPAQDSRTAIASTLSATCSNPFAAASSASMMSLCFITVMGSASGVLNSSASIRR